MIPVEAPPASPEAGIPRLRRLPFAGIARSQWDRLHALTPTATPFSAWTFHRAWWDAYGATAEEHYLVLGSSSGAHDDDGAGRTGTISAIVPLMMRHAETGLPDATWRPVGGQPGRPEPAGQLGPRTLYFAASYHADYATVLAPATHLGPLAASLAGYLGDLLRAGHVDAVDLRRLSETDTWPHRLKEAWRVEAALPGIEARLLQEDVCPVVSLRGDWQALLGQLDKKTRHEVRRKLRRAEREGPVELRYLPLVRTSVDRFIRLHQARWGSAGLFADDEDGDRSRLFLYRLTELEAEEGPRVRFHLGEVTIGDAAVYALAGFAARGTCYFYNAGMDPAALDLSPGIVGTAAYLRDRIERGDGRFDFLRGGEPYKYHWGAVDTRLDRLVIERVVDA